MYVRRFVELISRVASLSKRSECGSPEREIHKYASTSIEMMLNFVFTNLSITYFTWIFQCYQLLSVCTCLCVIVKGDTFEVNHNKHIYILQ